MTLKHLLILGIVIGAGLAFVSWPRINDVETGRTPEYADLKERVYVASEERVTKAAKEVIESLPGWSFVGAGKGPGGSEIQAVATTRVFRFKDDVTIRIRRSGDTTRLSVRSRSRIGKLDFGQNARNIRAFLAALDKQIL